MFDRHQGVSKVGDLMMYALEQPVLTVLRDTSWQACIRLRGFALRFVGLSSNLRVQLRGDSALRGEKVQHPVVLCCIPGVLPEPKIETPNNQR